MNRKQFVESHGATCDNWNWSWSFVNHEERLVIFGAWDDLSIVFSRSWEINVKGHRSKGFNQSLEHLRLVQEQGYRLLTFPMEGIEGDDGIRKIVSFEPTLKEKLLFQSGVDWLALDTAIDDAPSEVLSNSNKYPEGAKKEITINAVERNPKARAACLRHHGHTCVPCGFDFMAVYGEIGREYIHVHHIYPLKLRETEYEVDPINDLVPVCPNCHAMIHRREPCLSVDELRALLKSL